MATKLIIGATYRVVADGDKYDNYYHQFKQNDLVTCDLIHNNGGISGLFTNRSGRVQALRYIDVEAVEETTTKKLPTWCDLIQHERHTLLGELVDAMIYSGKAVLEVQSLVEKFKTAGYVRSVIFPNNEN